MGKNPIARRHHYISQSYLARFTDNDTKKGKFFVSEVDTVHVFQTTPSKVAVIYDFNRIDIDGCPSDVAEKAFSQLESDAKNAISNIVITKKFPNDEDYNTIVNLICLFKVRHPATRQMFNDAREQVIHKIGDILVSEEKLFNHHFQKMKEENEKIKDPISFKKFKSFVEERKYKITFSPGDNLQHEMKWFENMLTLLGERTWSLIIAPSSGPEFICSDNPVIIRRKSNQEGPVGLGTKGTFIFFPLSPYLGFYGTFENPLEEVVHAKEKNIAAMNSLQTRNAQKHIFSRQKSFIVIDKNEIINIDLLKLKRT